MNRWAVVALAVTFLAGCRDATGPEMPVGSPLFSHFAASTWNNTEDLSVGRHFLAAAAASLDGRVFVSGGLGADGLALALVEAYDPGSNMWTAVEPLLGDRYAHASVRGGDGRIHVIGGITDGGTTRASSVEAYDPASPSPSWTSVTPMTVPRGGPAAAVFEGKIYLTGGENGDFQVERRGEVYDPANPATGWLPIAPMATARFHHAMATGPNGRIYAIGGLSADGQPIASVEEYDPGNDTWREVAPLPPGRWGLGAAMAGDGHIYAFGGDAGGPDVESTVFMYDVANNTWTEAPPMNQARFGLGATESPDGRIYAVAGISRASGNLNSAEWYLPGRVSCKVSGDRVTGGGFITGTPTGAKGHFSVSGGINIKKNAFRGHLEYEDRGLKGKTDDIKVKGTGVTAYIVLDAVTRRIEGTAKLNGVAGFTYQVDVSDNGKPGRNNDVFTIRVLDASGTVVYSASGTLGGGNIRLHKAHGRACDKDGHENDDEDGHEDDDDDGHDDDDDDGHSH